MLEIHILNPNNNEEWITIKSTSRTEFFIRRNGGEGFSMNSEDLFKMFNEYFEKNM